MKILNVVDSKPGHFLPNMIEVFGMEIKNLVMNLKRIKGGQFDLGMDLAYTTVNYAVELLYEYQIQGNGTIPENIKNKIWEQVIKGVDLEYEVQAEYFLTLSEIFEEKIKSPFIVEESIQFLTTIRTR